MSRDHTRHPFELVLGFSQEGALILLSGYPSSGLTYRAKQIVTHFTANPPSLTPSFKIVHISDDTLSIPRSAYDNARSEKDARAALSTAIKRSLGRDTLVIADAMNYIKGFRYQMYCEAKAASTPSCVIHVAANPDQATTLHNRRTNSSESNEPPPYSEATFTNLISRYEEPSASARWDSPLFTIPHSDTELPYDEIAAALFLGLSSIKPRANESLILGESPAKVKPTSLSTDSSIPKVDPVIKKGLFVKPHLATVAPKQMSSDALYVLEKTTSEIVKTILNFTSVAGITECSGEVITIPASSGSTADDEDLTLTLPTTGTLSVAHLQRMKRQFVSLYRSRGVGMGAATSGGKGALGAGDIGETAVRRAFVGFLATNFQGEEDS